MNTRVVEQFIPKDAAGFIGICLTKFIKHNYKFNQFNFNIILPFTFSTAIYQVRGIRHFQIPISTNQTTLSYSNSTLRSVVPPSPTPLIFGIKFHLAKYPERFRGDGNKFYSFPNCVQIVRPLVDVVVPPVICSFKCPEFVVCQFFRFIPGEANPPGVTFVAVFIG